MSTFYEAMTASRSVAHAILLILATHSAAAAQTPMTSGEIRGRVVNAAGKTPVAMAMVSVTDSGAAVPAIHTSTDADGGFRVSGLRPGRYRVRIVAIGYKPRELSPIEIGPSSLSADIGAVTLTPAPIELQSIVIQGQKHDVELAPDRTTYVVRDMPTTRGGTALDVLRNVPAVDVDIDNVVTVPVR